jgi:hypothetical protein
MNRISTRAIGSFVATVALWGCASQPAVQADTGWVTLIDGETGLENWTRRGADAHWRAADGVIEADKKTNKPGGGFLVSKGAYSDFEIRAEFWVSDDAKSGIFLRCADSNNVSGKTCYEVDIFDRRPDPTYGTGAIVNLAAAAARLTAGGHWNVYDITVRGKHLTVVLNGVRTVDVEDGTHTGGPFALQHNGGLVKFRKVQIRPL